MSFNREPKVVTVTDIFAWLGARAASMSIAVGVFAALFLIVGLMQEPIYKVKMTVAPAHSSGLSQGLGKFAGMAALAGISLPGGSNGGQFEQYKALLTSTRAAQAVIDKEPSVLHRIFYTRWDAAHRRWKPPGLLRSLKIDLGLSPPGPPDAKALAQYLAQNLYVYSDPQTNITTVELAHAFPKFVCHFLALLSDTADGIGRDMSKQRTDVQIAYLQKRLKQPQSVETRQVLIELLGKNEQVRMLDNPSVPFAVKVLDPPVSNDLPSSPRPAVLLFLGALAGFFIGIIYNLLPPGLFTFLREIRISRPEFWRHLRPRRY